MGFKDALAKRYADSYLKKYGDRLTQLQGHILSVKITTKTILFIFHKLKVDLLVKPASSKAVIRCQYNKNQWFKKPPFMPIAQGNLVIIQGMKGKKGKENSDLIQVINIKNLTNKKDLVKTDQKVQRVQQKSYIK